MARAHVLVALALVALGSCRGITPYERHELDGAVLLGARHQAGWENEDVPLIRIDGAVRPWTWPLGVRISTSLSGYAGDQTGPQSIDLALGLVRTFALVPERFEAMLGAGYLFAATEDDALFDPASDSWQAPFLEAGLYFPLDPSDAVWLGLEARYAHGDGPELGSLELDGEWLDLYLVVRVGRPGQRRSRVARPQGG